MIEYPLSPKPLHLTMPASLERNSARARQVGEGADVRGRYFAPGWGEKDIVKCKGFGERVLDHDVFS